MISWKAICLKKEHGRLGVLDLNQLNIALLSKWGWWYQQADHNRLWKEVIMEQFTSLRFWLVLAVGMLVSCFLLIFLFELFHGIAWCAMSGLPMSRMRFGMAGGGLLFQCHIDGELLTKREFVRGLIIPDLIFAAVLLVVGLCLNFFLATFLGAIVLMCTLGDIMIANKVRDERDDTPVYIHPD